MVDGKDGDENKEMQYPDQSAFPEKEKEALDAE